MLGFVDKPERPVDSLSLGLIGTIQVWFDSSMLLFPDSTPDEAVGHRAFLHSQGPYHAEMVGSSRSTGGRASAARF